MSGRCRCVLAERVGFEPTCRLPDKTLSRRPRYDHFGTSPLYFPAMIRSLNLQSSIVNQIAAP